jgi:hypothetical protein
MLETDRDAMITESMAEEVADREPQRPGGLTPEAEIVAQSKDPVDFSELDWHITSPQANPGKPDSECELGSCEGEATHHVELLSSKLFFGCSTHVDELSRCG